MTTPWHPIVLATVPILRAWFDTLNPNPMAPRTALLGCALLTGAALVLMVVGRAITGCRHAGSLVASAALLLNLSFLPIVAVVGVGLGVGGAAHNVPFQTAVAAALALIVAACVARFRRRRMQDPRRLTLVANVFAAVLLAVVVADASAARMRLHGSGWPNVAARLTTPHPRQTSRPRSSLPDVYFILLDGYGRADVLDRLYHIDNEPFLAQLRARGFHVVEKARSNYQQTALSVASTFNVTYLDDVVNAVGRDTTDRLPLEYMAQQGSVVRTFLDAGYRYIALSSFQKGDEPLADEVVSPRYALNDSSPITSLSVLRLVSPLQRWQHRLHALNVLHAFAELERTTAKPGPKFVFGHILMPHPPFVLTAEGRFVSPPGAYALGDGSHYPYSRDAYVHGYRGQVGFVNQRLLRTVDAVLERSLRPTVVMIQGDHGPGGWTNWSTPDSSDHQERSGILAAYLFPGANALWPTATPVNAWRLLMNEVLGTALGRVEDRSYYARWARPYDFVEVADQPLTTPSAHAQ